MATFEHPSPGVYTKIVDLSQYVATVPSTIGFVAMISERGPDNELVFTSRDTFVSTFGKPNINYKNGGYNYNQGPYLAMSFLRESDSLYVVRCLPVDAEFANLRFSIDSSDNITATASDSISDIADIETLIDGSTSNLCMFYGRGRGDWYNNVKILVDRPREYAYLEADQANFWKYYRDIYEINVYVKQEEPSTVIRNSDGSDDLSEYSIAETFRISFNPDRKDDSGESLWVEDVINNYSDYIRCYANETDCTDAVEANADFSTDFTGDVPKALEYGSLGTLVDATTGDLVTGVATSTLSSVYEGTLQKNTSSSGDPLNEVLDTETYYFSIIFDAGYPDDVRTKVVDLAKIRKDCVAIVGNGDNSTYSASMTKRDSYTYNTMYAARYECYTKVYDSFTAKDIWVSPTYHMARIIPYNDKVSELWYAPAGFNRAAIDDIKEMRFSPSQSQRDELYLDQINPIVNFSNGGHVVYGQLTTQTKPSALQDLNIVRLVLYIERALKEYCRYYIFEQNDETTWNSISSDISGFLKLIQNQRGLYSYTVDVGATDIEKRMKRAHVNIVLKPTRTLEQIYLTFFVE